ncbi:biopolymer transporter ExbD [Phaeocystidibacter luteus]|uniref:Biopolymer transporter ExbD n=1 Tax=Phaeocystidibacter luteus TaxID=911197 RepID=A0A6N6RG06_9FLAO|nr:biopolymer transporter ExbD [Phaeocystidibacter luteus]KAB2807036.1 biopolymer transporter ExbD [Phaeocystidibacter luteus]
MKSRRSSSFNAGSTADIAFLLLVFFLLVTTMQSEVGMQRKLPQLSNETPTAPIADHNILPIFVNSKGDLMVNQEYLELDGLRSLVKTFVDNNKLGTCTYCQGDGLENLSDSPKKAVVSITSDRNASYATYISVQNEIAAAYNELRNEMAVREYGVEFDDLKGDVQEIILRSYPMIVSEAQVELGSAVATAP